MAGLNRRDFLRLGGAGLALGTLAPLFQVRFLSQALHASTIGPSPKRLIFIFLRGGCDAANTVIPHGDPTYNDTADGRPNLYITPGESVPLNGFCALHPKLTKLDEVYQSGDLAVLHKIAMNDQSRSHFSSQHYWENAKPLDLALEEGWLNRLVASDPLLAGHPIPGASISSQLQLMMKGPVIIPQFSSLTSYSLGSGSAIEKLIGAAPAGGTDLGRGLLGVFHQPADGTIYDQAVRDTGISMAASLESLQPVNPGAYVPVNGATYPSSSEPDPDPELNNNTAYLFFQQLRDGVQLLKETDCRVVGIDIGGLDTHVNQGRLNGQHPLRMHMLAHGIRSVRRDLTPSGLWNDTLVVVASEFGRTSKENGSNGTDHGHGGCMFIAGGTVNGLGLGGTGGLSGVYNGDATTWSPGDLFAVNSRYLAMATDYRAVYAEILERHFGAVPAQLGDIIPGWSGLTGPEYGYLNFLS